MSAETSNAGWNDRWPLVLVLIAVLFNAIALRGELSAITSRNDSTFHLLMIREASAVIRAGGNPLDFWIPQLELGFPQFLYYQHLPHLLLGAAHAALGGSLEVETLFNGARYLLLVLMPVTVWWSMRRMGFSAIATCVAALFCSLAAADKRYGIEYASYVWQGFGMFTQLVGVHLFFIAFALLTRALRDGRGIVMAGGVLAALVLSHLVFGLIVAVASLVLLVHGSGGATLRQRFWRLGAAGVVAVVLASYMLVPFAESSHAYLSSMPWLGDSMRTSRAARGLEITFTGLLFDHERVPAFTVLAVAGALWGMWRRASVERLAAVGFVVMVLVYITRPDSAWLAGVLPAKAGWASFRFVSGVGMFAVMCVGIAGEALWQAVHRLRALSHTSATAVSLLLLLVIASPALLERWQYHERGRQLIVSSSQAAQQPDVAAAVAYVANRPGRAYAGTRNGWGCDMAVGDDLCLTDLLQARQLRLVGNPMQSLALSSGLVLNIPDDSLFVYDMLDIRTVVRPVGMAVPPFYAPQARFGSLGVYGTPSSGIAQYAAVVERRQTTSQRELFEGHLDWIRSGRAARGEVIRWDYDRPAGPAAPRAGCASGARFEQELFSSQSMRVRATCAAPSGPLTVVFKSMYHPQWRAWVDGQLAEPYMVSPGYLAVDVPPGTHDVVTQYRPHRAKLPLFVLGLAAFAIAWWKRARVEHLLQFPAS